jgi:spore coat polysaccharide biosynthesis protein SpsF
VKVVAIVQARVGSTRLPAKVLLDLGGATALQRCLDRVARFECVDEVVLATTDRPEDELIVQIGRRLGVRCTRGSADDVLSRYLDAARQASADVIVRCTSDCPLLDPVLSSQVIRTFLDSQSGSHALDYAANNLQRRLPRGLDTEIVSRAALERAGRESRDASEHEHVTLHVYRHAEKFRIQAVLPTFAEDYSHHRWTLDTFDDYRLLATIYNLLGDAATSASLRDVLGVFASCPDLAKINAHVEQKPVA